MRIPRAALQRYSDMLNAICEQGSESLMKALDALDLTRDVVLVRDDLIGIMEAACGGTSTMAARIAADFYDGLRPLFGIDDGFRALVEPRRDPRATEGAVRAFVQPLVDGDPDAADKVRRRCVERLDAEARQAANRCVEANARRDPRRPKWARVPMGAETCKFCIMLAGRGFAYHSEDMVRHSHANCDCRVIPGWDGETTVEGYDREYYLDCYRHPDRHPEVKESINARRRELRAERKAREGRQ